MLGKGKILYHKFLRNGPYWCAGVFRYEDSFVPFFKLNTAYETSYHSISDIFTNFDIDGDWCDDSTR